MLTIVASIADVDFSRVFELYVGTARISSGAFVRASQPGMAPARGDTSTLPLARFLLSRRPAINEHALSRVESTEVAEVIINHVTKTILPQPVNTLGIIEHGAIYAAVRNRDDLWKFYETLYSDKWDHAHMIAPIINYAAGYAMNAKLYEFLEKIGKYSEKMDDAHPDLKHVASLIRGVCEGPGNEQERVDALQKITDKVVTNPNNIMINGAHSPAIVKFAMSRGAVAFDSAASTCLVRGAFDAWPLLFAKATYLTHLFRAACSYGRRAQIKEILTRPGANIAVGEVISAFSYVCASDSCGAVRYIVKYLKNQNTGVLAAAWPAIEAALREAIMRNSMEITACLCEIVEIHIDLIRICRELSPLDNRAIRFVKEYIKS
jgi:hypothetical protein